jgi:hypothetical protein
MVMVVGGHATAVGAGDVADKSFEIYLFIFPVLMYVMSAVSVLELVADTTR